MITEDKRFIDIQGILAMSDVHPADCIKINDLIIELSKENQELENTITRLEEEVNKQAKRIDKTTQAIDELLSYDDFKDITNASFGNVKEELKFYLSNYKTLEEFRKANLKEND